MRPQARGGSIRPVLIHRRCRCRRRSGPVTTALAIVFLLGVMVAYPWVGAVVAATIVAGVAIMAYRRLRF